MRKKEANKTAVGHLLVGCWCILHLSAASAEGTDRRRLLVPDPLPSLASVAVPRYAAAMAAMIDNTPSDNIATDEGIFLGRALFYDKSLSRDGRFSCASCHQQSLGFTDGKRVSVGHDGRETLRNSMPLVNLRYQRSGRFFWDHRAETLEQQVLQPIASDLEMGHQIPAVIGQLQSDPIYPRLFASAFGDPMVTRDRLAKALAQFIRSIVSFQSRYDIERSMAADSMEPFANFSPDENLGKQIFHEFRCAECHLPSIDGRDQDAFFQTIEGFNNGIDVGEPGDDDGMGDVTGRVIDQGKFKASSLRNIDVTGPYMHDGRFVTVDSVVEHYNWSVKPAANLDPRLRDFADNGMALPETKKVALEAFLSTLTDHRLLQNPDYADPWRE